MESSAEMVCKCGHNKGDHTLFMRVCRHKEIVSNVNYSFEKKCGCRKYEKKEIKNGGSIP